MRIAELREKYIMDREAEMKTAREIGMQKVIKEGIKQDEGETLEKVAKKLKNINIPIDKIIQATGLTKEKIEKL